MYYYAFNHSFAQNMFFFLKRRIFLFKELSKIFKDFCGKFKDFSIISNNFSILKDFSRTFLKDFSQGLFEACANHELGGPGTPAKMFGRPKGSLKILFGRPSRSFRLNCFPEIFLRVQPCSPLVIGSNDTLHAIVECGSAFLRKLVKGMQI